MLSRYDRALTRFYEICRFGDARPQDVNFAIRDIEMSRTHTKSDELLMMAFLIGRDLMKLEA